MQWIAIEISAEDKSIYVPAGCANAYMTTSDSTIVHYYMSKEYKPDSYSGFNYKDNLFGFKWPSEPFKISEKDNNLPMYKDLKRKMKIFLTGGTGFFGKNLIPYLVESGHIVKCIK